MSAWEKVSRSRGEQLAQEPAMLFQNLVDPVLLGRRAHRVAQGSAHQPTIDVVVKLLTIIPRLR